MENEIDRKFEQIHEDYIQQANIAKAQFDRKRQAAETKTEVMEAEKEYKSSIDDALRAL